jgi:hypothetical protein
LLKNSAANRSDIMEQDKMTMGDNMLPYNMLDANVHSQEKYIAPVSNINVMKNFIMVFLFSRIRFMLPIIAERKSLVLVPLFFGRL